MKLIRKIAIAIIGGLVLALMPQILENMAMSNRQECNRRVALEMRHAGGMADIVGAMTARCGE